MWFLSAYFEYRHGQKKYDHDSQLESLLRDNPIEKIKRSNL